MSLFLKPPEKKAKKNIPFFRFFRNKLRGKMAEEGEKKGDIEEEKEDQLLAEALAKSRKERAEDADIFDFNF